jgi:hypothetical protein
LQTGNHVPGRRIATGAFSNKLLRTKYQAPPIKHSSEPKPFHPEGLEPHCLNRSKRVNKKAIPKNGPIIFAKRIPTKREKSKFKSGNRKKATENQFYPNQNTLDKPIGPACDVVQPGLLAGCCAPLKVLYIIASYFIFNTLE